MIRRLIWITQKELLHAQRDADVLIYAVLVPLLLYPLLLTCAGETVLRQLSGEQIRCNLQNFPDTLKHALAGNGGVNVVASSDPLKDLKMNALDLVVATHETNQSYEITAYTSGNKSALELMGLHNFLEKARSQLVRRTLIERGIPLSVLDVYHLNVRHLLPAKKAQVEERLPVLTLAITLFGLLQGLLVAAISSVCAFAEEREKNTYETTLTLPVAKWALLLGKWTACTLIATASACLHVLALALTFVGLTAQVAVMARVDWHTVISGISPDLPLLPLAMVATVTGIGLSVAVCLAIISGCPGFRDGQTVVMYPLFGLMSLPLFALIPGIERNWWAMALPLTNLLVALKHPALSPWELLIACAFSWLWTAAFLWLAAKIFFNESGLVRDTSRTPQRQSERV